MESRVGMRLNTIFRRHVQILGDILNVKLGKGFINDSGVIDRSCEDSRDDQSLECSTFFASDHLVSSSFILI